MRQKLPGNLCRNGTTCRVLKRPEIRVAILIACVSSALFDIPKIVEIPGMALASCGAGQNAQ